jgi:hypothetical protein
MDMDMDMDMCMLILRVVALVRQLPQGNRQHQPHAAQGPRRDARPEALDEGEVLAGYQLGCSGQD